MEIKFILNFYQSKNLAIAKLNEYKDIETKVVERQLPKKKRAKILLKPNGKYYALLIGNSKYDDNGWDQLVSPENDIDKILKVLNKSYKFEKIITALNVEQKNKF